MKVICLSGYPGAGKSVAKEYFSNNGIQTVKMGTILKERAHKVLGGGASSEEIGQWATEQREKYGDEVVAEWTVSYINTKYSDEDVVVVDGLRSIYEYDVFNQEYGTVLTIFVEATRRKRLNRLTERGRDGEDTFSLADLRERDKRERKWGLDTVETHKNTHIIENNSSERAFLSKLDDFMSEKL